MNLNDIRVYVRTQLDLDETDLPDLLLNGYIQDGYDHIISMERRWPFFETIWQLTVEPNGTLALSPDVDVIESLLTAEGRRLVFVPTRWAENNYAIPPTQGSPAVWSLINRTVYPFPAPAEGTLLRARGFRKPADWIADGASGVVDADIRLHLPIVWYACSLGYAQQEDEVLEATYLNRFREAATIAHDAVMRAWTGAPKILNGIHYATTSTPGGPAALTLQLPDGAVVVP